MNRIISSLLLILASMVILTVLIRYSHRPNSQVSIFIILSIIFSIESTSIKQYIICDILCFKQFLLHHDLVYHIATD